MKALFCHDHHYYRLGEQVLSKGQYNNDVWQRYLDHFDHLTVAGRDSGSMLKVADGYNIAGRDRVAFDLLPDTNSLFGRLFKRKDVKETIRLLVADHDVIILRGISEIGMMAYKQAARQGKIIAMEMVADPFDELWYHGSLAGKLYAPYRSYLAGHMVWNADAVIYVSQMALQEKYPTHHALAAAASNVQIGTEAFCEKNDYTASDPFEIGLIGTLKNNLKGVDTVIKTAAILRESGYENFAIHILGPGDINASPLYFQKTVQDHKLQNHVYYDGLRTSGKEVWQWLRELDLYIQPSRQEGVPRAMIEAMAQGLPAIGSDVGGVSELLDTDCLIRRGDSHALAVKIRTMMDDADLRERQGRRNFNQAKTYASERLMPIRNNFWASVKKLAETRKRKG